MNAGKFLVFILLFGWQPVFAQETPLRKPIHLSARTITIDELGRIVKQQTGLVFSFSPQTMQSHQQLPLDKMQYTVEELLGKMEQRLNIDYRIIGDHIVFRRKTNNPAPNVAKQTSPGAVNKTSAGNTATKNIPANNIAHKNGDAYTKKNISPNNIARKSGDASAGKKDHSQAGKPIFKNNITRKSSDRPAGKNDSPAEKNDLRINDGDQTSSSGTAQNIHTGTPAENNVAAQPLFHQLLTPVPPSRFTPRMAALSAAPPASVPAATGNTPSRRPTSEKTWLPGKLYAAAGVSAEEVFYISPTLRFGLPYAYGIVGWSGNAAGLSSFRYGIGTRLRLNDRWEVHLQGVTGKLSTTSPVDSLGLTTNVEMKGRHYRVAALAEMRIGSRWHISAGPSFNHLKTTFYYRDENRAPDQIPGTGNSPDSFFSLLTPPFVISNSLDRSKPYRITTWIGLQAGVFFNF